MISTGKASPFLKWAGSKRRLVPELLARIPSQFGTYYEPFAGGASLLFALAPERAVVGDVNADLIATYRAVSTDPATLVRALRRHAAAHAPDYYYSVRERWRDRASWSSARRASAFIYLNKTCFNGLWRVNRAGNFNVPMGRYDKPTICDPANLHAAHTVLQNAELKTGDFRSTIADAERGDVVYFDPPYVPLSRTANFTSYSSRGFTLDDQRSLADTARELVARGIHVIVSNSDTSTVRKLYMGFRFDTVKVARSINSDASGRGEIGELIITGRIVR